MKTLTAFILLAMAPAFAAAPNVGVVDVAEVMTKYNKAIETKAGIDKSVQTTREAVAEREKELQSLRADLESTVKRSQDPILNEAGKRSLQSEAQIKQGAFQQRQNEYVQFVQSAQGTIQQRLQEMERQVVADVRVQAEKIAKDKGLQLVIPKAVTFFNDGSLDITADVIKALNDAYKSAAPAPAPAAPAAK
ncbi:MAG: OmpH family outer membrane protein [Verrucomicrobia bacterium]|nr:OmpH family outer membrane protein [Verrucomicrobiota bacterium]